MDPITLAVTSALGNLGAEVINDTYQALKKALQHKYGVESDLTEAVQKLEEKPDSEGRLAVLEEEVKTAKADKDEELLQKAKALIEAVESQPGGKERIEQITQYVWGDHNTFTGKGDIHITH